MAGSWIKNHNYRGEDLRAVFFSKISFFSSIVSSLKSIDSLTKENLFLKDENRKLTAELAVLAEIEDQNDFLRRAADIKLPAGYEMIDAGVFNMQFTPEGHYLLINKGEKDNIKVDDIIVTSSGVLVGRVSEISGNYSRAELITNPKIKITVRFLEKNVISISRGALNEGLKLDFISQNDEISEGDKVITNGNDMFPYGFIVGMVSTIKPGEGDLFKDVTIDPEFRKLNLDRVLIISR
jgi:rod shape-determining protein MreC